MSNIKGGYILQPRTLDGSSVAKMPPVTREIWLYLLRKVNYCDSNKIKKGSGFFSYKQIQEDLSWWVGYRKETYSKPQIAKSLRRLHEGNMVETMKATHGVIITVCNYCFYQDPKNYEGNDEGSTKETRRKRQGSNIQKKDKEIKEKETTKGNGVFKLPEEIPFEEWNAYLQVRARIKCANTDGAKQLLVNKLLRFKNQGYNLKEVLEEATEKSWKSVYEPKERSLTHETEEVDHKLAKWRADNAKQKTAVPN